jgi:hypothetical protein
MKCDCGGNLNYKFTAQKDDHEHKIYECDKCGAVHPVVGYRYTPGTCPKHHWGFEGWGFNDGKDSHEIYWKMRCDRCGATHNRRFDSSAVGLRQAVQLEDPRVLKSLELTNQTARFHLPSDDVADFWK